MQTLMVYSEAGGVTKTTTAVSIAAVAAASGRKVVLIDLDPRAAATRWFNVEPKAEGLHVGAILADTDPEGWVEELAVPSGWFPELRVVPSARSLSNREADNSDHLEVRLRVALEGLDADLVVIDCANRQGGPLTQSALNAADTVVYAATATSDGVDGFLGAQTTVQRFMKNRERLGAPVNLVEAGVVVGGVKTTIMSRAATASIEQLEESGLLLYPLIPERAIVQEVRLAGEWYGEYRKGLPIVEAYEEIVRKVVR